MSSPFSLAQPGVATIGTGAATFGDDVTEGNLLVCLFAAQGDGDTFTYPTGVTDTLGNSWTLFSQSAGIAANEESCAFLFVAVAGSSGANEVTVQGFGVSPSTTFYDGPSVIIAEIAVPTLYQIWALGLTIAPHLYLESQRLNTYDTADSSLGFRAFSNNGLSGGTDFSDTGACLVTLAPQGSNIANCASHVVGFALGNQFGDVFLVIGNYNTGGPPASPYWVASGTLIDHTVEGSGSTGRSAGLAYGDFPYESGEDVSVPVIPGLTLDESTGAVTGIPSQPGSFPVTFSVTDSEGGFAEVSPTFAISGGGCR